MSLYGILGIALLVSLAVSGFMVFAGIGDVPDSRSSHKKVTPTGGGLGMIAALGVASLLLAQGGVLSPEFAQVLALIWAIAFLGLMDDIYNLAPGFKLAVMVSITAAAVWVVGPVTELPFGSSVYNVPIWFGWAGSMLWVFVVMNIVNFMDGSNGLMLVVMAIASAALAWISFAMGAEQTTLLLLMLLAGMIGLVPYNMRKKARIFSGDVGALTIGLGYAMAVLWLCQEAKGATPVYIGPVLIMPFLADALFTMARRAKHKEDLLQAHSSHLYQRMIRGRMSHISVAMIYGLVTAVLGGLVLWAIGIGLHRFINFILVPGLLLSSVYMVAGRKFK